MSKQPSHDEPVIEEMNEEIPAASAEIDYKLLWQRSQADLENGRRRLEQEKQHFVKFANQGLLEDLYPVLKNFYLATAHIPENMTEDPWVVGVQRIQDQLTSILKDHGLEEIKPARGDQFDPNLHEALSASEDADVQDDQVTQLISPGFQMHGKVVVPAQVIVKKDNSQK